MLLLITTSLVTDELIKLALLACLASYLRFSPQKWKSYPPSSVRCKFFFTRQGPSYQNTIIEVSRLLFLPRITLKV